MLELNEVSRSFGYVPAVRDISLACADNEFLVLFGPAGAGKSTTLRLVAGILKPNAGDVLYNSRSLNGVPPERRNMSMAFENYALYSHLVVRDNLAFPLRARRMPSSEVEKRVNAMAEKLQIVPLLDRKPGFLSGGQRQRVALGRALIREANVYLLDEPISHLDAKLRHRMRGELKSICAEKEATVMHVTHDYREAMALSDRVAVIKDGRILQVDHPDVVFHKPNSEFVATFVGDPPMSFLDVEYVREGGRSMFALTGTSYSVPASREAATRLEEITGETIRLGVRAASLSVKSSKDRSHTVPGRVYVTETLGFRNVLLVEVGSARVRVFTEPERHFSEGDTVWLNIDDSNTHVFVDGVATSHPRSVAAVPAATGEA